MFVADLWDPTEDFLYGDFPEDFEVELDEHLQVTWGCVETTPRSLRLAMQLLSVRVAGW